MIYKLESSVFIRIFTVFALLLIRISKPENVPDTFENLRLLSQVTTRQDGNDEQDVQVSFEDMISEFTRTQRNVSESPASSINSVCVRDLTLLVDGLINRKASWAVGMLDASGKPSSGILRGSSWWIGEYKECFRIQVESSAPFNTAYCSLTIGNVSHIPANAIVKWDLCVPSRCADDALKSLINTEYLHGNIKVLKSACSRGGKPPLNAGAIAVICLLSVVALMIVLSTVYDIIRQTYGAQPLIPMFRDVFRQFGAERCTAHSISFGYDKIDGDDKHDISSETVPLLIPPRPDDGYLCKALLSFSACKNIHKILSVDSPNADSSVLHAVNGIRFLSMSWVILGHTWIFILNFTRNVVDVLDLMKPFSFQVILNGTLSVDTFFLLSGTLLSYQLLRELKKVEGPQNMSWIKLILHRYFRLTPVYMLVLAVFTTLFKYWCSGPFGVERSGDPCESYWWTNLLYINNFFDSNAQCFGWSWYLANDMQFFLLSLVLVALIHKHFLIGMVAVSLITMASWIATGVILWVNNYPASTFGFFARPDQGHWFRDVYVAPWCRAGSYLVGVVLGAVLHRCNCKISIHWTLVVLGWCLAAALSVVILYVPGYNELNGHLLTAAENVIYGSVYRTLWAVSIGWVIFACVTNHGGYVNTLLSWSGFAPLSRLTYCAYLVHPIIIFWNYQNLPFQIHVTHQTMIMLFCGHLLLSYAVAFVISVTLEAPMINIMAIIMRKDKRQQM